ncbi:MAG TPA: hypothetical protein VK879_06050 [Candidatus Sulfomarinibacteraceae bacterium]|nr:hypothetical protein [Candidatus Sulfomarinibacteraceae bacterium]
MFNPLYLLTFLPAWMVGMYLLHLARGKRQEAADRQVPATASARREQ